MFKICSPDANTFSDVIKVKPIDELDYEYTDLGHGGYWTVNDPFYDDGFEKFKGIIKAFPIQKDNNRDGNPDPNPFDTIHVPTWVSSCICYLMRDFYVKYISGTIVEPNLFEWGNIYYKGRSRPIIAHRLPHIDNPDGLVGNLWFTDHEVSGTDLFKFNGKMIEGNYDFMVNYNHPKHPEYKAMLHKGRSEQWFNFDYEKLEEYGFEYLGRAPAKENTITIYQASMCHNAYIDIDTQFRWSHTFAFANNRSKHAL